MGIMSTLGEPTVTAEGYRVRAGRAPLALRPEPPPALPRGAAVERARRHLEDARAAVAAAAAGLALAAAGSPAGLGGALHGLSDAAVSVVAAQLALREP